MKKQFAAKPIICLGLIGLLMGISQHVAASAFQLFEQNAVNTGDAGAGGAAIAEDASTAYFNPAGLMKLQHQQLVTSFNVIRTDISVRGTNTWRTPSLDVFGEGGPAVRSGTASGGVLKWIPAFHYALPINNKMAFGFSVAPPFGLATEYDSDSYVNTNATRTELDTLDLSPNVAYQVTPNLSLGLGLDVERADAELDLVATALGASASSINTVSGWGYGWHAGALYDLTPATRIGFSYRSQVSFELQGSSKLVGPLAGGDGGTSDSEIVSNHLKTDLLLPPSATLSLLQKLNKRWSLLGSISYTKWDTVRTVGLDNVAILAGLPPAAATTTVALPASFRNTWRLALGTSFIANEKWLFRGGVGYDQTPTNNNDRDIRLPEGDRYNLSIGTHYKASKTVGIDLGWTHVFMKSVRITAPLTVGGTTTTVNATSTNRGDIVGAQVTWDIS